MRGGLEERGRDGMGERVCVCEAKYEGGGLLEGKGVC